jgi:hypothetical protein
LKQAGWAGRRGIGKSDPIDARRIAAAVLPLEDEQLRTSRMDEGIRAAAQILLTARDELTRERTKAVNALTALVRIADLGIDAPHPLGGRKIGEISRRRPREEDADLGIDARHPLGARKIGEISRWRRREEDLAAATARTESMRLAKWTSPLTPRSRTTRTGPASSSRPAPLRLWSRRPGSGRSPRPPSWSPGPIPDGSGTRPRSPLSPE